MNPNYMLNQLCCNECGSTFVWKGIVDGKHDRPCGCDDADHMIFEGPDWSQVKSISNWGGKGNPFGRIDGPPEEVKRYRKEMMKKISETTNPPDADANLDTGKPGNWRDEIWDFYCKPCDQRFEGRREQNDGPGCDCVKYHSGISRLEGDKIVNDVPAYLQVPPVQEVTKFTVSDGDSFDTREDAERYELQVSFNHWYNAHHGQHSVPGAQPGLVLDYIIKHRAVIEEIYGNLPDLTP